MVAHGTDLVASDGIEAEGGANGAWARVSFKKIR